MRIRDLAKSLDLETVQGSYEDGELKGGCTSDLLSDVMANAAAGDVLVTIQAHRNTVAVASLVGISAIVLCSGRPVPPDMESAARDEGIAIFRTSASQFEVSGRLWVLLRGPGPAGT